MEPAQNRRKLIAAIVIIAAVVLIAFGTSAIGKKDTTEGPTTGTVQQETASTVSETTGSEETSSSISTYKDGTYTASTTYPSPGGDEDIKTTLTIKDGIITVSEVEQNSNNNESAEYHSAFAEGYKSKVIGKALSGLNLSTVSGASLSTSGFNELLDDIRDQSKA